MNREIKFRGKRIDGQGWVYGVPFLISPENKCFMINNCQSLNLTQDDSAFQGIEVFPESVDQFLGLKDWRATEIYGGSIVTKTGTLTSFHGVVTWNAQDGGYYVKGTRRFTGFASCAQSWSDDDPNVVYLTNVEVIGNIYDNPELLPVTENRNKMVKG